MCVTQAGNRHAGKKGIVQTSLSCVFARNGYNLQTYIVPHIDKPRTGGVELHELGVLQGNARAQGHGVSVAGAGVRRGAAEVGAPVAAGRQHRVVCSVGM
jgi:hypothetical protein